MREEWVPVQGGKPNLTLWPETPEEALLTPVEARLLHATLEVQIALDPSIKLQIASARVVSRDFTNYGFFINFLVPMSSPAALPGILSSGTGLASIGSTQSKRLPLATLTFSTEGRLDTLEAYSLSDGESEPYWSAEDCVALLRSPLSTVCIFTSSVKDWAASDID